MTNISQPEINKAAWNACDTFRGVVDPSIYKDYVLTMLFLKYVSDVWRDHRARYEASHSPNEVDALMAKEAFVLPPCATFDNLHQHRHEPGNGARIDEALRAIEESNGDKLRDVFQDISFNSNKLGDAHQKNDILRHLLEDFAKPALDLRPSRVGNLDIIGGAYEYLISRFAATAGKKAGEFYTPPEVSELMAHLVEPKAGDDICDPACGSASLLMKCGKLVRETTGSNDYTLYGQEAIGSTWALAKTNLFLHGEGNHRVEWGDTIRNPKLLTETGQLMHFDVVVANPPFSLDKWGLETAMDDKFGRFHRGFPPKTKGDYAFILHILETLKPDTGRMAMVAPHGVLFRTFSEAGIRRKLIEENLLDAVIGLPEKLFFGTPIPAVILVFRKRKKDESVLFIDASREFKTANYRNVMDESHIKKITRTYKKRRSVGSYASRASLADIESNGFNLNIPRYVNTIVKETELDLKHIREERAEYIATLTKLERRMKKHLRELGYDT